MTQKNKATVDPALQEAFAGKLLGQFSGTMTVLLASLGDRLGLFKDLAARVPRRRQSSRSGPVSTSVTCVSGSAALRRPAI